MNSAKKSAPLFRIGDWVSFNYGPKRAIAEVLEDRGPLGVRGRRLYRIQIPPADDPSGEPSAFEMPEDELVTASPPVRQSYTIRYVRQGHTNDWRATTKIEDVHRGVKAKGAVSYTTGYWAGEGQDEPRSASVSVYIEVDPRYGEPGFVVAPDVEQGMVGLARSLADEMFLSRHPRAKISHVH
jgi:hypothetical protein